MEPPRKIAWVVAASTVVGSALDAARPVGFDVAPFWPYLQRDLQLALELTPGFGESIPIRRVPGVLGFGFRSGAGAMVYEEPLLDASAEPFMAFLVHGLTRRVQEGEDAREIAERRQEEKKAEVRRTAEEARRRQAHATVLDALREVDRQAGLYAARAEAEQRIPSLIDELNGLMGGEQEAGEDLRAWAERRLARLAATRQELVERVRARVRHAKGRVDAVDTLIYSHVRRVMLRREQRVLGGRRICANPTCSRLAYASISYCRPCQGAEGAPPNVPPRLMTLRRRAEDELGEANLALSQWDRTLRETEARLRHQAALEGPAAALLAEAEADREALLWAVHAEPGRSVSGTRPKWRPRQRLYGEIHAAVEAADTPDLWARWGRLEAEMLTLAAEWTLRDYREWAAGGGAAAWRHRVGKSLWASIRRDRFYRVAASRFARWADNDVLDAAREGVLGAPGFLPRVSFEAVVDELGHAAGCTSSPRTWGAATEGTVVERARLTMLLWGAHPDVQGHLRVLRVECSCGAAATRTYAALSRTWGGAKVIHRVNLPALPGTAAPANAGPP